jgi:hypothetical protein
MKLILLFSLTNLVTGTISYQNFKLYSVLCLTKSDVDRLKLWDHNPLIDFCSSPGVNRTSNIVIAPDIESKFVDFLSVENFNYEVLIENIEGLSHQLHYFFDIRQQIFRFSRSLSRFSIQNHQIL